MRINYKTFYTALLIIVCMITCVLTFYTFSINSSLETVREDIRVNNLNRIRILMDILDRNITQLDMLASALEADTNVGLLHSLDIMDRFERITLIKQLSEKMNLQSLSEGWNNQVAIYVPLIGQWIGVSPYVFTSASPNVNTNTSPSIITNSQWVLDSHLNMFISQRNKQDFIIQVSFPQSNIIEILNSSVQDKHDSFLYYSDGSTILSSHSDPNHVRQLLTALTPWLSDDSGTLQIPVNDSNYMINYVRSTKLGWYMIDSIPLDEAQKPIVKTKYYFYVACGVLFLASLTITVYLYRKVQVPILVLLKAIRLLKRGDFSIRIHHRSNNEFDFLYDNFNDMIARNEELIEKVYKEKIVSREAMLKQLQAQINPHFLYNCLFFIDSMNRLGNEEAVTAMTQNLANYFRYMAHIENPMTTLEKEVAVVENYLRIQCLRMERLTFKIDIPKSMQDLMIPKLLIQPLVENSIIHGIEKQETSGEIWITGIEQQDSYSIKVEDNGSGLTEEEVQVLMSRISQVQDDSMGCALWNVRQRMNIYFNNPAGIQFDRSKAGGLSVTLFWKKQQEE